MDSFKRLAEDLRDQNSQAFSLVHRRYVEHLVRLAKRQISRQFNSKIDPEEIVQSVFKSFFVRFREGKIEPQSWNELWNLLATITRRRCNRVVNRFRSEKRNVHREVRLGSGARSVRHAGIEDKLPDAEEQAMFTELLAGFLEPLSDREKEMVARRLEGYSKVEISEKVGCSERSVHRAFEKFGSQFERFNNELNE